MRRAWFLPVLVVVSGSAAAAVRAANDGNETVPTVVVAAQPHTNPDPAWVRRQLSRRA